MGEGAGPPEDQPPESMQDMIARQRSARGGRAPLQQVKTAVPYAVFDLEPDSPYTLALGRIVHRNWSLTFGWDGSSQQPISAEHGGRLAVGPPDLSKATGFEKFGVSAGQIESPSSIDRVDYWDIRVIDSDSEIEFLDADDNVIGHHFGELTMTHDGTNPRFSSYLRTWFTARKIRVLTNLAGPNLDIEAIAYSFEE